MITKHKSQDQKEAKKAKTEHRLAFMGLVLSSIYITMCCVYTLWFFGYYWLALDYVFAWSTDLFSALNPYLLLAFSSKFRACFVNMVR